MHFIFENTDILSGYDFKILVINVYNFKYYKY